MPLTKEQKEKIVEDLTEKLSKMRALIFVDFTGLNVKDISRLRKQLKEHQAEIKVAKKTLIDLALKKRGIKIDTSQFRGQLALTFDYKNELSAIKTLDRFSKENKFLQILSGIIKGDYLEAETISLLANLPSRKELLAKLIGSISAPISGLINVLEGNLRNLVFILSQVKR